jgi:PAP2 superfamily
MWVAAIIGATGLLVRPRGRVTTEARAILREVAIVTALYGIWRLSGELTLMGTEDARSRGLSVWRAERWLHLPNERTLQQWCMHALWLVRFANVYYIVGHVAPIGVLLVWLFFRHRDRYPAWRNVLFFVSIVCALLQLVPVAPPRMYPELGFIDTGAVFGPRVYAVGEPGQLAAMPSLHVGWAVLIGIAVVMVSRSRWRWLVLVHPVLTMFAVTVTAYHWLLDGIVAVAILVAGMFIESGLSHAGARKRTLRPLSSRRLVVAPGSTVYPLLDSDASDARSAGLPRHTPPPLSRTDPRVTRRAVGRVGASRDRLDRGGNGR